MTRRTPAQYNWSKLEFDETLLTKHFTPLNGRDIKFVVVHHMTIVGSGTGSALDACYRTWQDREASAHYGVDGELVRQFVWDKDFAWATGSNSGNLNGISIEHANSTAGPKWLVSAATLKTGAKLAAQLHKVYKLGRPVSGKTLRQHDAFTSTACPGPFLGGTYWAAYVAEAQRVYDAITGSKPASSKPVASAIVKKVAKYVVMSAKLYGYEALTAKKTINETLSRGDVFTSQAWRTVGGALWVQRNNGSWFDGKHLDLYVAPALESWFRIETWNLGGMNDTGRARWDRDECAKVNDIAEVSADIVCVQELAGPNVSSFSARMAKVGYVLVCGSDGRYIFRKTAVREGKSGVFNLTPIYAGDDKQAAWAQLWPNGATAVFVTNGHLEFRNGAAADAIRVKQALSQLKQGNTQAESLDIPVSRRFFVADTNSEGMVRDALKAVGHVDMFAVAVRKQNATTATFTDWNTAPFTGPRIDLIAVHKSRPVADAGVRRKNAGLSDHLASVCIVGKI